MFLGPQTRVGRKPTDFLTFLGTKLADEKDKVRALFVYQCDHGPLMTPWVQSALAGKFDLPSRSTTGKITLLDAVIGINNPVNDEPLVLFFFYRTVAADCGEIRDPHRLLRSTKRILMQLIDDAHLNMSLDPDERYV